MKTLLQIKSNPQFHWVGDGFFVRTIFSYQDLAQEISPFLMMDYAAPTFFSPTEKKRGVGEHPHRGFETVTIVYSGEVEHRDSAGGGGVIKDGDVQWMTAASGLVHEEFHGKEFAQNGGQFEMVQLWVNLPSEFKMSPPRYQGIKSSQIPQIQIGENALLRVIAGDYQDAKGPAKTFTPINLWDLRIESAISLSLKVPSGHTSSLFVLEGNVLLESNQTIKPGEIGVFEPAGETLQFRVDQKSKILFLGGQPLNEPIVGYGPFVMNTHSEIRQAFEDYQTGKMGRLNRIEGTEK